MAIQFNSLPVTPLRITSKFGKRNTGIAGASTDHKGIDLGADKSKYKTATDGGPVMAVMDGTITTSSFNKSRGWVVIISHAKEAGKTVETLYQHLKEKGEPVGKIVKAGDKIGTMGNTGVGAQLHLHFELRLGGTPINPELFLYETKIQEEDDDMVKYKAVKDVPSWGQEAVKAAMAKIGVNGVKILQGDAKGDINLSESDLRGIVREYRLGLYK